MTTKPYHVESDPGDVMASCPVGYSELGKRMGRCCAEARSFGAVGSIFAEYIAVGGICQRWRRKYQCARFHKFTVEWTVLKKERLAHGRVEGEGPDGADRGEA